MAENSLKSGGEGHHRLLWLILGVALLLRLIFALVQDPNAPYADRANDAGWYLGNAYTLITGQNPPDMQNDVSNLASPPVYFIVIGVPQMFLSPAAAVIAIRVLQALLSTATCCFAYRLARLLTGRESAGLIAGAALAVSPAFILESAQILTETMFIFLTTGGVWLYVESVSGHGAENILVGARYAVPLRRNRSLLLLACAAVFLGLAALTRAVLLAFPLALALHLLLVRQGRHRPNRGWAAALFLLIYALVVSTWTIYSVARWNRFVIAGEGLSANLYLGATATGWTGAQQVDQALLQQSPSGDYIRGAESVISGDPIGWIEHRISDLAGAYLQPHGTTFYPGASLRDLAGGWLAGTRSLADLVQGDAFWSKLALYLFHYAALLMGLVGMALYRRRWRVALPMVGFIAYLTLVHLVLYALPRYLFPAEVFWWVFAAAALDRAGRAAVYRRSRLPALAP